MKINLTLFAAAVLTFSGCVSKSDYEKVKNENDSLTIEIKQLKIDINIVRSENQTFREEKQKLEEKKRQASYHSEEEALRLVKDYYEFYDADQTYRNPRVRRISNNSFRISLEECTKKGSFSDDNFFWRSTVVRLTISEDGKYDFSREMN